MWNRNAKPNKAEDKRHKDDSSGSDSDPSAKISLWGVNAAQISASAHPNSATSLSGEKRFWQSLGHTPKKELNDTAQQQWRSQNASTAKNSPDNTSSEPNPYEMTLPSFDAHQEINEEGTFEVRERYAQIQDLLVRQEVVKDPEGRITIHLSRYNISQFHQSIDAGDTLPAPLQTLKIDQNDIPMEALAHSVKQVADSALRQSLKSEFWRNLERQRIVEMDWRLDFKPKGF
jgi:hypothetical protein